MNKNFYGYFLGAILILSLVSFGFMKDDEKGNNLRKINTNDNYQYIGVNQCLMYVSNNGDGSHDPRTDGNGFYWPGGINGTKSCIFEDGLIFAGKIGREIRMNGNTHRQGLQAGKILDDGTPDDPTLDKYRVFKIVKGWESLPPGPERDAREKDYNEWPIEDGAPYEDIDGNGEPTPFVDKPLFLGDETLWYVANDMDESRSTFTYGTLPLGLEFQTTIFGYKRTGALGDMVFKKYTIINKGNNDIRDMILGYWSDTDMGDANDDYTGCDTALSLGYTWNATNTDGIYGSPPPGVGYDFFQGPIVPGDGTDSAKFLGKWRKSATIGGNIVNGIRNLPMTAFAFYINGSAVYRDPQQGNPAGSAEFYNYLQGLVWNGEPFKDPTTSPATDVKFVLAGDPVAGTGWYEGAGWPSGPSPGDRRHLMASGPFFMAKGDTQEIVVGIVIAQGSDNINSITALKEKDKSAQLAYDFDFQLTPPPPDPKAKGVTEDQSITLWWGDEAESYRESDPLLPDSIKFSVGSQNYAFGLTPDDKYYEFQGYRLWQFKDESGANPTLLATWDKIDTIGEIRPYIDEYVLVNGSPIATVPIVAGFNSGLQNYVKITKDAFTNGPLYNGNTYYFAVTAYGYSKWSDPPVLENAPVIVAGPDGAPGLRPGTPSIDRNIPYNVGDDIVLNQVSGQGDGIIKLKVIDPNALTGHTYRLEINGQFGGPKDTSYTLIDITEGDTLFRNDPAFLTSDFNKFFELEVAGADTVGKKVYDGFLTLVYQSAQDSIEWVGQQGGTKYPGVGIKAVLEVKGPNGVDLPVPVDVARGKNSTQEWGLDFLKLNATFDNDPKQNLAWSGNNIGWKDYEIRFTAEGSEYYSSGYGAEGTAFNKYDPKGKGKVPFEVWDVGNNLDQTPKRLYIKIDDEYNQVNMRDTNWSQGATGLWEPIYVYKSSVPYPPDGVLPDSSTPKPGLADHIFGRLLIEGNVPAPGTVIRIETWQPLSFGDAFEGVALGPTSGDATLASNNIDKISVFPNPYFGANELERDKYQRFVRFTNLPAKATIRIFSLAGVFIQKIDKDNPNDQYLDWDLRNKDGLPIASGIYLAHIDIPGVGEKILKIAVVMETQFIDRL